MSTTIDLIQFILQCMDSLRQASPKDLYLSVTAGSVAAGLIWFIASIFSRAWNTRFSLNLGHHLLCSFAAFITLFTVVGWTALSQAKVVAGLMIDGWKLQVNNDGPWSEATFKKAYYAIRDLKIETFTEQHPPPEQGGKLVPLNQKESKLSWASTYANGALDHFAAKQAFLSLFLWAEAKLPKSLVEGDVNAWFVQGKNIYPAERAISLVAEETHRQLRNNLENLVAYARGALLLLFGAAQAITFGLIAYAAYKDLKDFRAKRLHRA
jgi:hypothetical protein